MMFQLEGQNVRPTTLPLKYSVNRKFLQSYGTGQIFYDNLDYV
jgi:hypothetical protein